MRPRLNQSIPWSQFEAGGFVISALISGISLGIGLKLVEDPDAGTMRSPHAPIGSAAYNIRIPDPTYVPPVVIGFLAFLAILLLNTAPLKRLHGSAQFMVCAVAGGFFTRQTFALDGLAVSAVKALAYGSLIFLIFRVNWWAWWEVPSRRTVAQRMAASIFFTGIPILGFGFAVWRLLLGLGIHHVTTQFIVDAEKPDETPLETIIEDPALAEHARRIDAIRAAQAGTGSGRKSSEDKDAVSESI